MSESGIAEEDVEGSAPEMAPLLGEAGGPVAVAALAACIVGGAIAGWVYLPEEWHLARRLAGGGVSGFGCWLLVMVGRVIG